LTGKKSFSFEIKDNLEPSGSATYLDYQGFIDGKWILLEYDLKKDKITHRFDPNIKGKHTLKLLISDIAGNTITYESPFFR